MFNPIKSVINNIKSPDVLTLLGFVKDPKIADRIQNDMILVMGLSREELFPNINLPNIYWVDDNFSKVDKSITPNIVIVDNPQDCTMAIEISVRYQIPLAIVLSSKEWENIRPMDRILIQEKIPDYAGYLMLAQDKIVDLPQLPPFTTVLSQEHLVKVLKTLAQQQVILS